MPHTLTTDDQCTSVLEQVTKILKDFSGWNRPHPSFVRSMLTEHPNANDREVIAKLYAAMAQPTVKEQYAAIYNVLANTTDVSETMFKILSENNMVTGTASKPGVNFPPEPQTNSKDSSASIIQARAQGG